MSTIFAIVSKYISVSLTQDGELITSGMENGFDYVEIAFRNSKIRFYSNRLALCSWLPDDTPVYPIDNTPQGIYTIGDIRKQIKK